MPKPPSFYPFVSAIRPTLLLAAVVLLAGCTKPGASSNAYVAAMLAGKNAFDNADAPNAIAAWTKAVGFAPTEADAHLNLANAFLLAGEVKQAIAQGEEVLKLDRNSAAALYVLGCAQLRSGQVEAALKALQQAHFIDPSVAAVSFQLGHAQMKAGNSEAAVAAFREAVALEPQHPSAHYALSQALMRVKDTTGAQASLAAHQAVVGGRKGIVNDPTFFEKCVHTRSRLPAVPPEQPDAKGVPVRFVETTAEALGGKWHGPAAVLSNGNLIVAEQGTGFRLLANAGGKFSPVGEALPGLPDGLRGRCLVGDLNNDRFDDVLVLSAEGGLAFKGSADGSLTDMTSGARVAQLRARDGVLADYDFTGKLGVFTTGDDGVKVWRNQGSAVFSDVTATLAQPVLAAPARGVAWDDWNGDDLPDLFVAGDTTRLLLNQHGGKFTPGGVDATRLSPTSEAKPGEAAWPKGNALVVGDVNNDLRNDLIVATAAGCEIVFGGMKERATVAAPELAAERLQLLDYDNDGWLDLFACGPELRVWRNGGRAGFSEVTAALGLGGAVENIAPVDFDADGDTDLLLDGGTLRLMRNDGGNANRQVAVRLITKRSNGSGLGTRFEFVAGGWRVSRTVNALPFTVGVGRRARFDSVAVHWADLLTNLGAVAIDPAAPIMAAEPEFPTGSCPYLYVWDGRQFRFVTDLLGAAPAGLRLTDDKFIDADTEEIVRLGDESDFVPRDGEYLVQITEELREVLYLDHARMFVVDHAPGLEIHSTSKLRPGKPIPPHQLVALRDRLPLRAAVRSDGLDATALLAEIDARRVSPVALRAPQRRGLAEPFSVTLDFGPLPVERPLVLALTGWLRFGGGMANVGASHDPALPFPFPTLEVETGEGMWQPVEVLVGAPAGKTKTIVADLAGKLPAGARRLRLTQAFETHWDRIALFSRDTEAVKEAPVTPAQAELHYRGTSEYADLPADAPLTPDYARVRPVAPWHFQPTGWCTGFGDVRELLAQIDDALVLMHCGDELTMRFPAASLPPKAHGTVREFFLLTSGWDKDADFHVAAGMTVEPVPWHGMDDQRYGQQPRPAFANDAWIQKYNTRWIGPLTLGRKDP